MRKLLVVTNALLGVIALCLLLLVAKLYDIAVVTPAYAASSEPQNVRLVYWDDGANKWKAVQGRDGAIRTTR